MGFLRSVLPVADSLSGLPQSGEVRVVAHLPLREFCRSD